MGRPGKFEACENQDIAERLHDISLDGCCDECGDVCEVGHHYCLLIDTGIPGAEFVILEEDGQGFVTYETFDTKEEAIGAFAQHEYFVDSFYEDEEDEEEE